MLPVRSSELSSVLIVPPRMLTVALNTLACSSLPSVAVSLSAFVFTLTVDIFTF